MQCNLYLNEPLSSNSFLLLVDSFTTDSRGAGGRA